MKYVAAMVGRVAVWIGFYVSRFTRASGRNEIARGSGKALAARQREAYHVVFCSKRSEIAALLMAAAVGLRLRV